MSRTLIHTANKRIVAPPPAPPPGTAVPFATEDFTGGARENPMLSGEPPAGQFRWTPTAGDVSVVNFDGFNCLRFRFPAQGFGNGAQNGRFTSEQRFWLGRQVRHLSAEYWLHVPANYAHRQNQDAVTGTPIASNNKFFTVWRNPYDAGPDLSCWGAIIQQQVDGASGFSIVDAFARGVATTNNVYYGINDTQVVVNSTGWHAPFIGPGRPIVPGGWTRIRTECKHASSADAAQNAPDGILRVWAGDTLVMSTTTGRFWDRLSSKNNSTAPGTFVDRGYFFGEANSGYAEQTDFHVRNIKFYEGNPGWV